MAVEVELAHAGLVGQSREAEILCQVFRHPIGHSSQLEARQRRGLAVHGFRERRF
jgi:hypothetical protein